MPAMYYVYRLAALHKFPHVEDLLAQYQNGNELGGWMEYFQEEDARLQKMLTTALAGTRPVNRVPQAPAKPVERPEPVVDMTSPAMQESFLKFVTGQK